MFKTKQEKLDEKLFRHVLHNEVDGVKALINAGADVNGKIECGGIARSILIKCIRAGCPLNDSIRVLVESGADLNIECMHAAIIKNAHQMLEYFFSRGADINIKGITNCSLLHTAAVYDRPLIVKLLLEKGIDFQAKNIFDQTPYEQALSRKHMMVAQMIVDHEQKTKAEKESSSDLPAGWSKIADDEIVFVSEKPVLKQKVFEIFNFSAGRYTQIVRNTETNAESQAVVFFGFIDNRDFILRAAHALTERGGTPQFDGLRPALIVKERLNVRGE